MSQACEGSLTNLSPEGLAGESGVEAALAKPSEYGTRGGKLSELTGSLLASAGGVLVDELSSTGSLLASASGLFSRLRIDEL